MLLCQQVVDARKTTNTSCRVQSMRLQISSRGYWVTRPLSSAAFQKLTDAGRGLALGGAAGLAQLRGARRVVAADADAAAARRPPAAPLVVLRRRSAYGVSVIAQCLINRHAESLLQAGHLVPGY